MSVDVKALSDDDLVALFKAAKAEMERRGREAWKRAGKFATSEPEPVRITWPAAPVRPTWLTPSPPPWDGHTVLCNVGGP